jgi:DNA/RNA-binding domain of Phe-tRNA-synthetase-like protein
MNSNFDVMISRSIEQNYPDARIGVLILELAQWKEPLTEINNSTDEAVSWLKQTFPDLNTLKKNDVIEAYTLYYKNFKKTYHLLPQLESVIFNDKKIKASIPLLQAVFTTELKNMLLTAVHDLDAVHFPLNIGVASGQENYHLLNGSEALLKKGDMFMSDNFGVISSIIYGPDQRTKVTPRTSNVLVVVYAPKGIGEERVERHFEDMISIMTLISQNPKIKLKLILPEN